MSALHPPEHSGLSTLFLDLNSYFASVEQNDRPELRGKPVAVVPMMTDSTCAIAASYEAKAYGIKTGTPVYEAKKMCPNLVYVLARHDLYVAYHHKILAATDKHLPIRKIWSIDEFDCELIGRQKTPETARDLAQAIKTQIYKDVGPSIRCSIGIAPNSFLAKVATDMQKPDGLVLLHPESLPGPLLRLSLRDLPGINVRMEERLHKAGIRSIKDLWHTSPRQARMIWGSVQGERFWYWLHGYDVPVPETSPCMVGHSRVLDPVLRTPEKARLITRRLLFKATARLRRKEFYAAGLSLGVRFLDGRKWTGDLRFSAANDFFTFQHHLDTLWRSMTIEFFGCLPADMPQRLLCKKVSVVLHMLQQKGAITDDLLDTALAEKRKILDRRQSLSDALDKLQKKYNRETVSLGITPKTLAGHVGTKIAFSRVPDIEEFSE